MNTQKISVLILSYSNPQFLRDCVAPLLGLSFVQEILIYDNHSWIDMTDTHTEIRQKIEGAGLECVIKTNEIDTSLAVSYNWGLDTAKSSVLLCVNTDVVIQNPEQISDTIFCFENEKIMVVGHVCESEKGEMCGIEPYFYSKTDCRGHFDGFLRRYSKAIISTTQPFLVESASHRCVMLRRTELRFDEALWYRYDMLDFCNQVNASGGSVLVNPGLKCMQKDQNERSKRNYASIEWQKRVLDSNKYMVEKYKAVTLRKSSRRYVFFDIQDRQILEGLKREFMPPFILYFAVFIAIASGLSWGILNSILVTLFFVLYFFMMWFIVLYQSKTQLVNCGYINLSKVTFWDVLVVAWVSFTKDATQTRKYIKTRFIEQ